MRDTGQTRTQTLNTSVFSQQGGAQRSVRIPQILPFLGVPCLVTTSHCLAAGSRPVVGLEERVASRW